MNKIAILLTSLLISANSVAGAWYEVPMQTVEDFRNIPARTLDQTMQMTYDPAYHIWVRQNLLRARELNWRPGHHKPDGTCYACHVISKENYEQLKGRWAGNCTITDQRGICG